MEQVKPMKVLQVVGAMNRAGTETMLMNIYRNIDREKIQFDFISYSDEDAHYDQEIRSLGGRVFKLSKTQSLKEIYDCIKKNGPYDVVHSHTLFHCGIANLAALLAGVKIRIAHAHTTFDHSETLVKKIYITCMRYMIHAFSNRILACSEAAGIYLFGKRGLNQGKYAYFPNVIDNALFLNVPSKDVTTFKVDEGLGNNIVIGHIGRFIEAKNHLFLIEIMKRLLNRDPSMKLLLVGDGELKQLIEKRAKKEGISENIRFVGIRNDISTLLHSMDIFVFPSIYEGLGLVLLEAQASGIPCVVSEAIQPEADVHLGLISQLALADGPEAWAEKIMSLTHKKEKDTNRIIEAFERSSYSLTGGIALLMQIYHSNIGESYERNIDRFV